MKQNYTFLFLLLSICYAPLKAQNRTFDSVNTLIKQDAEDSNKVNHIRLLAGLYYKTGDLNNSILKCKEAIILAEKLNLRKVSGQLYNRIGRSYIEQADFANALSALFKAIKINNEVNNKIGLADTYLYLGNCFMYQNKCEEALNYFSLSLKEGQKDHNNKIIQNANTGKASVYVQQGKNEEALKIYFECVKNLGKDSSNYAAYINNIANIYARQKNYTEALKYALIAQKYCASTGDKRYEAYALSNLSSLNLDAGRIKEAEINAMKVILLAKETDNTDLLRFAFLHLTNIDSVKGDYKSALRHYKLFITYRDSINNIESQKSIIKQEAKHEYEKKEELAKAEIAKKEARAENEKQKQNVILFSVTTGLLLVGIFSLLLYKRFRQTQQQKNIIVKQKHLIEEHQKETIDSITYAKRIQDAILPPLDLIKEKLPNSFVLFTPKDIVAGDFYWMEEVNDCILIAVADCTGHGVPGAMVSVVCSNALNRTVKEFKLSDTGLILDKVTDLVLETFEKSATDVKDGMDISLLSINKAKHQIQWSGANNPLWYFESEELKEIKANKQPIGKSDHRKPFTSHTIEYKNNSIFYLFTDGYADQFGGPKGKKFKYKQLQEIIATNLNKTPGEQYEALISAFENWKDNAEQVDDVCIIGIKI